MQIYVCVICKANKPPLEALSLQHRQILETILSPAINTAQWQQCCLMSCASCRQGLQTVLVFQENALAGARHLLALMAWNQKHKPNADPLQMEVKKEGVEDNPETKPFLEIEVEPEKIGPAISNAVRPGLALHPLRVASGSAFHTRTDVPQAKVETTVQTRIDIKVEADDSSATASGSEAEDEPAAPPIRKIVIPVRVRSMQAQNINAGLPQQLESRSATFTHQRAAAGGRTALDINNASLDSRSATFTHQRAAAGERTALDINNASIIQLLQNTPKLPRLLPKMLPVSAAGTSATAGKTADRTADKTADEKQTHTQKDSAPASSPWYIRVLKDAEVAAERQEMRESRAYSEAQFRCEPCVEAFGSAQALEEHARLHLMSAGRYLCGVCGVRVRGVGELSAHRARHTVRYCCCYCPQRMRDQQAAEQHRCDPRTQQWNKTTFTKNLERRRLYRYHYTVVCEHCLARFATEGALAKHNEKHHKEPLVPVECKECHKVFKNKYLLKRHSYHHKRKGIVNLRPELFCTECKVGFATPSAYRKHRQSARHGNRENWKFICDYCGKKCESKAGVRIHITLVHTKVREFKCPQCPKGFVSRCRLKKHAAAHAPGGRARPHVCERCGKAFTCSATLKQHMNTHSGVRPYKCAVCPATFAFSGALYTHNKLKHLKIKGTWKKKGKKAEKKEDT